MRIRIRQTIHFEYDVYASTQKEIKQTALLVKRKMENRLGVLLVDEFPLIEKTKVVDEH